jgi:hypothetical protein
MNPKALRRLHESSRSTQDIIRRQSRRRQTVVRAAPGVPAVICHWTVASDGHLELLWEPNSKAPARQRTVRSRGSHA